MVELSCQTVLGLVARDEADYERARSHLEQSSAIATALGREGDVVVAKMNLGTVAFDSGDHDAGVQLWEDVLVYHRTNGNDEGVGFALLNLGVASYHLQRVEEARVRFGEAETLFARIGFREHFAHALQGIAAVDAADGHALSAARLLGRAARLLAETGAAETNFDAALSRRGRGICPRPARGRGLRGCVRCHASGCRVRAPPAARSSRRAALMALHRQQAR